MALALSALQCGWENSAVLHSFPHHPPALDRWQEQGRGSAPFTAKHSNSSLDVDNNQQQIIPPFQGLSRFECAIAEGQG